MEKKKRKTERTHRALEIVTHEALENAEPMALKKAMEDFIIAKTSERSAPRTLQDYRAHFRYLLNWLDERYPKITLNKITPVILREYITWMSNEKEQWDDHPQRRPKKGISGLSPMTVNVRIRTMKAFFNWCAREGYKKSNPAADIKLQKVDEDRISAFKEDQLKAILAAPDRNTFNGFRDYVIMAVLTDTGLRISELLGLTKYDVDLQQCTLTVQWEKAKTRKTRSVPISKKVATLLMELVRENEDFGPNANYLFYSSYGRVLTPDGFDERLKLYGKQAGIGGVRCSAHTFRHTFAFHWIKQGGDAFSLQRILGHTDMSMVKRYIRLSDGDVKEKHQQFSPMQTLLS